MAPPNRLLAWVAGGTALALTVAATACAGGAPNAPSPTPRPTPAGAAAATPAPSPTPTPVTETPEEAVAGRFLTALSEGRYQEMWEMLAAAQQTLWRDPAALAGFLERKFGSVQPSFLLGQSAAPAAWRDPETGTQYAQAVQVPLTLLDQGQEAAQFSLAPLALVQENGAWRVAGPGAAGRRGPMFAPPPASAAALVVPALVYHHVSPAWPDDFEQRTLTVTTAAFEAQLAYLQGAGYHTITTTELANALFYGLPLPDKPVLLIFDDGFQDAFTEAFPKLQQYGFSGVFALPTGLVGGQGYVTWEQAQAMSDAGMDFVAHSVSHADLRALPPEALAQEVRQSRADLQARLSRPVQVFVYPYGEPFAHGTAEQQQAVVQLLQQEGYVLAFSNPLPGTPPDITQRADQPYSLPRVMVSGGLPLDRFAARLEGTDTY